MNTPATAPAAGAVAQPVLPAAHAPAAHTASVPVAPLVPAAPVGPVAPVAAELTPFKSAQDFIESPGDALAARYGITEPVTSNAAEAPALDANVAGAATEPVVPSAEIAAPGAEPFTPITKFALHDEQGEFEIPANVKLTFNAGGKEYKGLRLDEVVRMAQQAPMADKHRQDAEQLRPLAEQAQANLQQLSMQHQAVLSELQQNNALYEQLLSNPQLYQEAASRFQAMNTPDQRLARLEEQRRAESSQHQQQLQQVQLQHVVNAAANYTVTRIAPSVDALVQKFASSPAFDSGDVMAKFHELTAPLLSPSPSGGVWVPPNRLQELETTVLPQLEAWASARAQRATTASTAATQKAQTQLQAAQRDAQLATRQLSRPLTPAGTAPRSDAPRPKPIKTSTDAIDSILDKARQQIQGAA